MGSGRSLFVADYVQKDFVATNTKAAINEPNDIMSIITYGQDDWVLPGERAFKVETPALNNNRTQLRIFFFNLMDLICLF